MLCQDGSCCAERVDLFFLTGALQHFPQPEWEKRMFPGNSNHMPVQFQTRQRGAGVGLETQGEEDGVSEDDPEVEWGSREWERLRLAEKVLLCTT